MSSWPIFLFVVKKQKQYQCWKRATCEWVEPLAPGVIMARAVDKLKGDTIKFSWFSFLSSLYRILLNVLAALVTNDDGSWFWLFFFASTNAGHFLKDEGTCVYKHMHNSERINLLSHPFPSLHVPAYSSFALQEFLGMPPELSAFFLSRFQPVLALQKSLGCILHPDRGLLQPLDDLLQIDNCLLQTQAAQALQ